MQKKLNVCLGLLLFCWAFYCSAAETKLSIPMDYALIRNVLLQQLYTGEAQTARFWKEGNDCSFLDASNPQITADKTQIKIENTLHARIGLVLGGKCMPIAEWRGQLFTWQQPTLDATRSILSFPVTQLQAQDASGQLNSKQIQDLINKVVQPKLSTLKIDLNASREDVLKTLLPFVDANKDEQVYDTLHSLRFNPTQVTDSALVINLAYTINSKAKKTPVKPEAVFTEAELAQWQDVWKKLEQNLEAGLSKATLQQKVPVDLNTLQEVLAEADSAFTAGLTEPDISHEDPVREYLNNSWDKLGPMLRDASKQLPGTEGLRYLTLISATDLLYAVNSVATPLGLDISANGFRKLVRNYLTYLATQQPAK
jgi:hypothetical protein